MVVLITGASSGLGREVARMFADKGYDIVFTFLHHEQEALSLKEELEKKVKVLCLKCDVTSEEDVKLLSKSIKEIFGKIDCLVNNAGISMDNNIFDKSLSEFRRVVDVNLTGVFNITRNIVPLMSSGSIINVASTDGIDTFYEEEIDYAASKAGLITLTKIMAKQFAPNIRVNVVAPGWINTEMNKDLYDDFKQKQIDKILLKRFAEPKEVASVIYFLSSNDASYINGSVIRVDGGHIC